MHVLLVEPGYYTQYPSLGLLKISAWHKLNGDTVEFVRGTATLRYVRRAPDRVYVTSLWSWAWEPVHAAVHMSKVCFPKAEIWLGGIYASLVPEHANTSGADRVATGLISEVEDILPDYSLVPEWNEKRKASIFFTHRGCVRSCEFCSVPKLEGKPFQVRQKKSFRHLIYQGHNRVVLWDNNILGEPNWREVIEELKDINLPVDFNQGLDARFLTEEVAECFKGLNMPFVRLAYDFPGMGKAVLRAIENLSRIGVNRRRVMCYVLFNFKDSPEDLFERVRNLLDWGVVAYPMRFQPLDSLEKDRYVSPGWTVEQLEMVANARRVIGYGGAFPPYEGLRKKFDKAKNFEHAFGLYRTKAGLRLKRTRLERNELFAEMSEDHDWPLTVLG